jgi:peptidoglycan-associated lipoprotein
MKTLKAALVILGVIALIGVGGCSKKPAPAPVVPPPATSGDTSGATTPKPPATPATTPSPVRLQIQDAFFDYDQSELKPEARAVLTQDAEYLMQNPKVRVTIEGHCDERGTNEYNLALGDRRARAVRDFLINYGVEAARIETMSFGEERPFAPGNDESAWSQNRRAHFKEN